MASLEIPQLATGRRLRDRLSVSVTELRRMIERGDLKPIRLGGPRGHLRFRVDEVAALVERAENLRAAGVVDRAHGSLGADPAHARDAEDTT